MTNLKHGGNIVKFAQTLGCQPEEVLDFSANINPRQAVDFSCLQTVNLSPYTDPDYTLLKAAIKHRYPYQTGVDIEPFNGASAAIFALLRWLNPREIVLYTPIYVEYSTISEQLNCTIHNINRLDADFMDRDVPVNSTIVFVNPATPDGELYSMSALLAKWQAANCTILIDESFLDFCDADSVSREILNYANLFIIKSLSKFYGCAGIRVGFIMGDAKRVATLRQLEPAWKISSFDLLYIQKALANETFIHETQTETQQNRELLQQTLSGSGLFKHVYDGQANYILTQLTSNVNGYQLQLQLQRSRILIRVCDNFRGLDSSFVRFAVKDAPAIARLKYSLKGIHF